MERQREQAVLQTGGAGQVWGEGAAAGGAVAEAQQSVFIESSSPSQPSLVLHIYAPSKSPGLSPKGV